MTPYATDEDLREWAEFFGVALPADVPRLLELATRDVQRHLGARWDIADPLLLPEQIEALADATCVQAVFRAGQGVDAALGLDDGLAAVGGLSFSLRSPPRFSPEAAEQLAGRGLYARSGTVLPDAPA